jgi:predicted nucleic acid-binding Zn ribbon protein
MSKHGGSPRGRPTAEQRHPERIGEVMSRLLARTGYAQTLISAEWEQAWSKAAGPELGAHSRPSRLRRGVLEVMVRNSTVLQELAYRKREIVDQLGAEMPEDTVHDLRFRVGTIDENLLMDRKSGRESQ